MEVYFELIGAEMLQRELELWRKHRVLIKIGYSGDLRCAGELKLGKCVFNFNFNSAFRNVNRKLAIKLDLTCQMRNLDGVSVGAL